jgi:hypothetical protein
VKHDFNKAVSISIASNDFIKLAALTAASRGNESKMKSLARGIPSQRLQEAVHATKAAVAPGTSTDATWGGPLVSLATAFADSLRPFSVFDRMLNDMVRMPLNTRVVLASSGAQAGPILEFGVKPISALAFGTAVLEPVKIVSDLILSEELAKLMNSAATALIGLELRKAVALSSDQYFIDVLLTAPGVQSVSSSGSSAANLIADLQAALGEINIAQSSRLYLILPVDVWKAHSIERDVSRAFEAGAVMGNNIVPVPTTVLTDTMILADAQSIAGVSETIELRSSDQASVQMSDTPSSGEQTAVSLWQSNLVAVRAERRLAAALLRSDAAVLIEGVTA